MHATTGPERAAEWAGTVLCAAGLTLVGVPRSLEGRALVPLGRQHAVTESDLVALVLFALGILLLRRLLRPPVWRAVLRTDPEAVSLVLLGLATCLAAVDLGNATGWLCIFAAGSFAAGVVRARSVAPTRGAALPGLSRSKE